MYITIRKNGEDFQICCCESQVSDHDIYTLIAIPSTI
jgi:hypothetical protein